MKSKMVNNKEMNKILKDSSSNVYHRVYYVGSSKRNKNMKKKKQKYTLNQIGDALFALIERFDYVVKANNLKDLPPKTQKK